MIGSFAVICNWLVITHTCGTTDIKSTLLKEHESLNVSHIYRSILPRYTSSKTVIILHKMRSLHRSFRCLSWATASCLDLLHQSCSPPCSRVHLVLIVFNVKFSVLQVYLLCNWTNSVLYIGIRASRKTFPLSLMNDNRLVPARSLFGFPLVAEWLLSVVQSTDGNIPSVDRLPEDDLSATFQGPHYTRAWKITPIPFLYYGYPHGHWYGTGRCITDVLPMRAWTTGRRKKITQGLFSCDVSPAS